MNLSGLVRSLFLGTALAVATSYAMNCDGEDSSGCRSDYECRLGRVCVNGECVSKENSSKDVGTYLSCIDNDDDGFYSDKNCATLIDCDNNNKYINPLADEVCDNIDNNCNGQVDEGEVCFHCAPHHDHLGCFGNAIYWFNACQNPEDLYQQCGENEECVEGECQEICEEHFEVKCDGAHFFWYDSCGNKDVIKKRCVGGCQDDYCCDDELTYECRDDTIHEVDLCGNSILSEYYPHECGRKETCVVEESGYSQCTSIGPWIGELCSNDNDCRGDLRCDSTIGYCVLENCHTHRDCTNESVCYQNKCIKSCMNDTDCFAHYTCEIIDRIDIFERKACLPE
jgi:hypothetical protein